MELELGMFDLRQVLEGSLVMVKERALAHSLTLSLDMADDLRKQPPDIRGRAGKRGVLSIERTYHFSLKRAFVEFS